MVALSGLFKVRDLDVWWRVKTGEWIWTHRAIPDTDPFSHTAAGPWNCVEPAGNLFLYLFHAAFGQSGLAWAGAAMALGLGLLAVGLAQQVIDKGPRLGPTFLAIGLFAATSNYRFGPKPELFSLCGLAALLWLLHATERTRNWKLLYWAPPLILLWGWLHRGSTLSIAVFGAAIVVWFVRKETRSLAKFGLGALLLSMGALLLTPGMAHSISSAANVVSTSAYVEHIGEWQPLSWQAIHTTMPLLPPLVALWLLVAPVQRGLHFGTLVVLGTGLMAVQYVRFVPIFALAMMPEVAWGLARFMHAHGAAIAQRVRPSVRRSLVVATAIAMMAWRYMDRPVTTWGPGVHDDLRPAYAAAFLAANPPPGRMFNTFNYGSYLLYANGPEQKVFIDGRNDQVYSAEFFRKAAVTPGNNQVLAELVQSYDIGHAVLQCTKIVNRSYLWLYLNPEWHLSLSRRQGRHSRQAHCPVAGLPRQARLLRVSSRHGASSCPISQPRPTSRSFHSGSAPACEGSAALDPSALRSCPCSLPRWSTARVRDGTRVGRSSCYRATA